MSRGFTHVYFDEASGITDEWYPLKGGGYGFTHITIDTGSATETEKFRSLVTKLQEAYKKNQGAIPFATAITFGSVTLGASKDVVDHATTYIVRHGNEALKEGMHLVRIKVPPKPEATDKNPKIDDPNVVTLEFRPASNAVISGSGMTNNKGASSLDPLDDQYAEHPESKACKDALTKHLDKALKKTVKTE